MTYQILPILLAALVVVAPGHAQDSGGNEQDVENFRLIIEKEAQELSVSKPQDSDIINLVERVMMVRLAQTLNLTVEETQNLGSRVAHCRSRVYNLKWLRADLRQSLRESIEAGDEAATEKQLDKLLKLDITIAQLIEDMIEDAQTDLSVEQAAKFYLFIEDFERDLSRMIDKAQQLAVGKTENAEKSGEGTAADPSAP